MSLYMLKHTAGEDTVRSETGKKVPACSCELGHIVNNSERACLDRRGLLCSIESLSLLFHSYIQHQSSY